MPRHPALSGPARALPASVFDRLFPRLLPGHEVAPLYIGDTCLPPPVAARLGALGFTTGEEPDLYRYAPSSGGKDLLAAIARKARERNGLDWCGPEHVQVTAGATHALSVALRATCDHGDEVLVMTPYWPLIRGICLSHGLVPVEVPLSQALYAEPERSIDALIEPYVTPRTAAIYYATPNNPDGKVLDARAIDAIAALARRHDLWVMADEVYEHYTFDGRRHESIAARPGMAERTCTVYSFSKSYCQGGLRVGCLVAPRAVAATCRALTMHSIFSVPVPMQRAALAALEGGDHFVRETRAAYQAARDRALARLAIPAQVPEGAQYLFVDLTPYLREGERDAMAVLERLADVGVVLAPGELFGAAWRSHARLCFTAVAPDALDRAIDRVNRVLLG